MGTDRMSVSDLREWLSRFPPDAHVFLACGAGYYLTVEQGGVDNSLELD